MEKGFGSTTWADVKAAADYHKEREALLIQYIGEMNRGLFIVDAELRRGNVPAARETVAFMRLATTAVDGSIR